MALRSKGNIYQVKKESTFNVEPTFADTDVIEVTADTSLAPNVDKVDRKTICNSFVNLPSLAIKETGSGSVGVELIPESAVSGEPIKGDVIIETALGIKSPAGSDTGCFIGYSDAGSTVADMIYEAKSGDTGTGTLYKLSRPSTPALSLSIRHFVGGSGDDVITYTGIVPNSVVFNFPVADIATVSIDLGASGFNTSTGVAVPTFTCGIQTPYVGKNAVFKVAGTTYEAKDVSITISNTVKDVEALTGSGISEKIVTEKVITGSLTITFENFDELTKLKNNTDAEIYLQIASGSRKFAIYLPKVRYSSVGISDSDGLIEQTIEFGAFNNTDGEAILVGHE